MNTSETQMMNASRAASQALSDMQKAQANWDANPQSQDAWQAWRTSEDRWMAFRAHETNETNRHVAGR